MRKALEWVKENKKIIITLALIALILCALYFMDLSAKSAAASDIARDRSPTEAKLAAILGDIEGVGSLDLMINESEGEITGVVVVCSGANNIMTRNNILNAVSTALNIDKKIIAIYAMNV